MDLSTALQKLTEIVLLSDQSATTRLDNDQSGALLAQHRLAAEVGNNEEIYNVHNEGNKLWNFCNFVIVLEREYISITKQIYHLLSFMVEKRTVYDILFRN